MNLVNKENYQKIFIIKARYMFLINNVYFKYYNYYSNY